MRFLMSTRMLWQIAARDVFLLTREEEKRSNGSGGEAIEHGSLARRESSEP